jgi:hypothetical protein
MLTADEARLRLDYDPATGIFARKYGRNRGHSAGSIHVRGYRLINVDGVLYRASRLAWLIVYGQWPVNQVDHINGNRSDDRIANLRDVTNAENQHNAMVLRKNNRSGFHGVHFSKTERRWRAHITVGYRRIMLGRFKTAQEAKSAYMEAKAKYHPSAPLTLAP